MRSDILLVQPAPEHSATIRNVLEANGFVVDEAPSIDAAMQAARDRSPDVLVFHWSGHTAASKILEATVRRNGNDGCAIVTALDSDLSDALTALDLGYDDCVRIPVNEAELVARLRASLRRRSNRHTDELRVGMLLLDRKVHCFCINDMPVQLAPTEYRLLSFFLENPGRVLSRQEILKGAWQRNVTAGSRTVDVHVRRLRQVLEPYGCDTMIQTIRSFGYRFREYPEV